MAILYHAGKAGIKEGAKYIGSNREELSVLMGGPIGFAYGILHEGWSGAGIYELNIPDDCLVIVGIDGWDIPRRNYKDVNWDEQCKIIMASEAKNYNGEVAFLASDATFGKALGG